MSITFVSYEKRTYTVCMNIQDRKTEIEDNRTIQRFFAHNREYEDRIREQIHNELVHMIQDRPQKIKTVKGFKYTGSTIFEYKIVLDGRFACRVAYVLQPEKILVFFISTTIRKMEYVKLVAGLPGVTRV